MLAANVAEKKFYTDKRLGKEYWNLINPGLIVSVARSNDCQYGLASMYFLS